MPKRKFFLQALAEVRIHTRGYLPHWELPGATYSLTFRLNGSLPPEVIARITEEQMALERSITGGLRKLTAIENMDVRAALEERIDDALHASNTVAHMKDERIAEVVANALTFFEGERYTLDAWCVMPNHVHAVVCPLGEWWLGPIVKSWKAYTGYVANGLLRREGRFWAKEYFDRIIRDERDHANAIAYVLSNPVKAGLVNWRWVGTGKRPPE
ncbi:MAG TPA: transposase [Thermoanaerobaculia bacterium]|nr:transposase [Thermoanaerobaculia bacterium]